MTVTTKMIGSSLVGSNLLKDGVVGAAILLAPALQNIIDIFPDGTPQWLIASLGTLYYLGRLVERGIDAWAKYKTRTLQAQREHDLEMAGRESAENAAQREHELGLKRLEIESLEKAEDARVRELKAISDRSAEIFAQLDNLNVMAAEARAILMREKAKEGES